MKYLLISLISLCMLNSNGLKSQATLIYVGDPMCSWCYGFSEELQQIVDHFDEVLEIEMVMGGLRPYNQQKMPELKDFLLGHWQKVNHTSGQKFTFAILDRSDLVYDTEPPCRASTIVRAIAPKKELDFFKQMQVDFYFHNKDLSQIQGYYDNLKTLDIDFDEFSQLFKSNKSKELIKADFDRTKDLKVNSFPTLLLKQQGSIQVVSKGYTKAQDAIAVIQKLLDNK